MTTPEESNDSVDLTGTEGENEGVAFGHSQGKRQRKLTSAVWKDFEKLLVSGDNKLKAKCKRCGTQYLADSKNGTGNMRRHIATCIRRDTRDIGQLLLSQSEGAMSVRSSKFDPEKFRELITIAIIKHNLPFQFVDYEGIRNVFSYVSEDIKMITRNTAKADVLKIYKKEKGRLQALLQSIPGRINLTSDLWTSIATDGYICLTAHYIDNDWMLQKRILNFCIMPPPHNGVSIADKVLQLLSSTWGIEKKLMAITLDNASANDVFVDMLKTQLNLRGVILSKGNFFHVRCCAHILNLIVQDGLKVVDDAVQKVRESIKYVRGSLARKKKFWECVAQLPLERKMGLHQDVPTRWNSTFLMLESSILYRHAFCHLDLTDSNYTHCPTQEEWGKVEKIMKFLKVFYDTTLIFSGTKYPTANLYFSQVWMIQLTLQVEMQSLDSFISKMAIQMKGKYDKYWTEYNHILAMAVILDPRYKIQFVEFCYRKLYGSNSVESIDVRKKLFSLFDEYMNASIASSSTSSYAYMNAMRSHASGMNDDRMSRSVLKEFDTFESEEFVNNAQKSQLELYLDEPKLDRLIEIDVLDFWKTNQFRYPVLSLMARDLLSIPVSTVASESAFSSGGRILDQFRSCLKPKNVKALVCTRDWIFGSEGNGEPSVEELTEDIMDSSTEVDNAHLAQCSNPSESVMCS